jgi:ankyrin repeat protein
LSNEKGLPEKVKAHLNLQLSKITHRTYLWVYLIFDYLQEENFKKTIQGIDSMLEVLPRNVNEVYERILNKSKDHSTVRKVLSIILAAARPLTLSEMNIALAIDEKANSILDLDLEEEEDFRSRLRTLCGLFITVHHDRIYFLHQTAREFLVKRSGLLGFHPSESVWQQSIIEQDAHRILTEICVLYLNLLNHKTVPPSEADISPTEAFPFLDYSANKRANHYLKASINADARILPAILCICVPESSAYSVWFPVYWNSRETNTERFTSIMISSFLGLEAIVKLLLEKGADLETKDTTYGKTSLSLAAGNGHDGVVNLLLEKGADFEAGDNHGQTPLSFAAEMRCPTVANLLLEKGANPETKDIFGRTPLLLAAENGDADVVSLLLEKGASPDTKDEYDATPLLLAAESWDADVVNLLLEKGSDFEAGDNHGQTPLSFAAENGDANVVSLLLEKGASPETKDILGQTPLLFAAGNGNTNVVSLLLENGASPETKDSLGQTPLSFAAENGNANVASLLLEKLDKERAMRQNIYY